MQIKKLSLLKVFWKKLLRQEGARPEFYYRDGQYPEQVPFSTCNSDIPPDNLMYAQGM